MARLETRSHEINNAFRACIAYDLHAEDYLFLNWAEEYAFPFRKAPRLGEGNYCTFNRLPRDRVDSPVVEPNQASDLRGLLIHRMLRGSYARVISHVWTLFPNGLASGDRPAV